MRPHLHLKSNPAVGARGDSLVLPLRILREEAPTDHSSCGPWALNAKRQARPRTSAKLVSLAYCVCEVDKNPGNPISASGRSAHHLGGARRMSDAAYFCASPISGPIYGSGDTTAGETSSSPAAERLAVAGKGSVQRHTVLTTAQNSTAVSGAGGNISTEEHLLILPGALLPIQLLSRRPVAGRSCRMNLARETGQSTADQAGLRQRQTRRCQLS